MNNLHSLAPLRKHLPALRIGRQRLRPSTPRIFCSRNVSSSAEVISAGITALPNRTLIKLSGLDAPKFLQGLTTNNVDPSRALGWYTGFLNATGRIVTDAFVWPILKEDGEWSCILDIDESIAPTLQSYLRKHKLRSKVTIQRLEDKRIWTAWTNDQAAGLPQYKQPTLEEKSIAWGYQTDPRLMNFSHRFMLPIDSSPLDFALGFPESFATLPVTSPQAYNIRRFLNGIPEGPREMWTEHYQAHPSNLDVLNAVDFHKGCYVGQELTIRTEHTGVVRKRILPVQLYAPDSERPNVLEFSDASPGVDASNIEHDTKIIPTSGKREAGKWIAGEGNIGLAMCRLETMTELKVSAEGGSYSEDAEFTISTSGLDSNQLKVKAFIPEWLTERLRKPRKKRNTE